MRSKKINNLFISVLLCGFILTGLCSGILAKTVKAASNSSTRLIHDIDVEPENVRLSPGNTCSLFVEIEPYSASSSDLTFTSSKPSVARVDNNGNITAVSSGSAIITVSANDGSGEHDTCRVTVTGNGSTGSGVRVHELEFEPDKVTVAAGMSRQLYVEIEPYSASNQPLTYTSSNTSVATVSSSGVVKGINAGTAIITAEAKDGSGEYDTCRVTVTGSGSSSSNIVIRDIDFEPDKVSLAAGTSKQLYVEIEPYSASNQKLTYTSSNTSVATVSSTGVVKGVKAGTAIITAEAQDGSGKYDTCQVTVTSSNGSSNTDVIIRDIDFEPDKVSLAAGASKQLYVEIEPYSASDQPLTYTSSNTSVATVSPTGVVKGIKAGTAIITTSAQDSRGEYDTCRVTVTGSGSGSSTTVKVREVDFEPDNIRVAKGAKQALNVEIKPANASNKKVKYTSKNINIATVTSSGVVKGISTGTTTITATAQDGSGEFDTCRVTVTSSGSGSSTTVKVREVDFEPDNIRVAKNAKQALNVEIKPANASNKKVKYTSNNTKIATVTSSGVVKGISTGTTTITATAQDGSGEFDTCRVTVTSSGSSSKTNVKVTGIKLKYTNLYLYPGERESASELKPTITPTNASNRSVTWTSSNSKVVSVTSGGLITAHQSGTVTLTATTVDQGKTAKCTVTVSPKTQKVTSAKVNKSNVTVNLGQTVSLKLTATPNKSYIKDIRDSVSTRNIIDVDCEDENRVIEIRGLKKGTTTLNLTVVNNDGSQVKVSPITVTVK